jgi:DNA-binding MarR family transcriptional regulator
MSEILNKELEIWYRLNSENGTQPDGFTGLDHATLLALAWKADRYSRVYDKGNQALADRLLISPRQVTNRLRRVKDMGLIEVISKGTSRKKDGTQKIVFTLENGRSLLPALENPTVEVNYPNGGSQLPERWNSTTETVEAHFDPTYNKETNTEPRRKIEPVRPDPALIDNFVKLAKQEMAGGK